MMAEFTAVSITPEQAAVLERIGHCDYLGGTHREVLVGGGRGLLYADDLLRFIHEGAA